MQSLQTPNMGTRVPVNGRLSAVSPGQELVLPEEQDCSEHPPSALDGVGGGTCGQMCVGAEGS